MIPYFNRITYTQYLLVVNYTQVQHQTSDNVKQIMCLCKETIFGPQITFSDYHVSPLLPAYNI